MGTETGIDLGLDRPASGRVYDYLLGGNTHFVADRELAGKIAAVLPEARLAAWEHRCFVQRAVHYLARRGLRQFLDIGAGIPHSPQVHEIAQGVAPRSRVVYLDADPVVMAHQQALAVSGPLGAVGFLTGDLADPEQILAALAEDGTLDLSRPIALALGAVLHYVADERDPQQIVKTLASALAPGSALILTHAADLRPAMDQAALVCRSAGLRVYPRTKQEVEAYFEGWDLVDPGLCTPARWRPVYNPGADEAACYHAGVAVGRHVPTIMSGHAADGDWSETAFDLPDAVAAPNRRDAR